MRANRTRLGSTFSRIAWAGSEIMPGNVLEPSSCTGNGESRGCRRGGGFQNNSWGLEEIHGENRQLGQVRSTAVIKKPRL